MGHFLAATAVKTNDVDSLAGCIDEYAKGYGVKSQIVQEKVAPREDRHVLIYPVKNDWCVIRWPEYFNVHDVPAAKYISDKTSAFVSSVNVYDGDYWCHAFLRQVSKLIRFVRCLGIGRKIKKSSRRI